MIILDLGILGAHGFRVELVLLKSAFSCTLLIQFDIAKIKLLSKIVDGCSNTSLLSYITSVFLRKIVISE